MTASAVVQFRNFRGLVICYDEISSKLNA